MCGVIHALKMAKISAKKDKIEALFCKKNQNISKIFVKKKQKRTTSCKIIKVYFK